MRTNVAGALLHGMYARASCHIENLPLALHDALRDKQATRAAMQRCGKGILKCKTRNVHSFAFARRITEHLLRRLRISINVSWSSPFRRHSHQPSLLTCAGHLEGIVGIHDVHDWLRFRFRVVSVVNMERIFKRGLNFVGARREDGSCTKYEL